MSYYVGVDLGATRLRSVVADEDGEIIGVDRRKTPTSPDSEEVKREIQRSMNNVCTKSGVRIADVEGAGIGSIGPIDFEAGEIVNPPNLHDSIQRVGIVDGVRQYLDVTDVKLLNDSTAGLLGERFFLEKDGKPVPDDMVYLTLSTGISVGVSIGGRVLGENVGEVGHWIVDPERSVECGCGGEGHWEAYCGGRNVPEYARYLYENKNVTTDLPVDSEYLDARTIFSNYERDDLARLTVERINDWNEVGVRNVIHAFDPSVISVGGTLALENQDTVIGTLNERLQGKRIIDTTEIRPTEYGGDVVVRGALAATIND